MKDIIAVCNQKGGVGKSTTTSAISACLALKGYKVLAVDLDAQGNLSYSMGATNSPTSTLEILTGTATAREAITATSQVDLIPATPTLAGADLIIKDIGKEYRLKEALAPILAEYDYILLDCPPALGILTINALTACRSVLIPSQADIFSLQGIGQLQQTIQTVKKYCNPDLTIKGIVATRFNARSILSRDMVELLEQLDIRLFDTKIRECTALKEAQASKQDIFSYAPKSNAVADYKALVKEVLA